MKLDILLLENIILGMKWIRCKERSLRRISLKQRRLYRNPVGCYPEARTRMKARLSVASGKRSFTRIEDAVLLALNPAEKGPCYRVLQACMLNPWCRKLGE
jgi:hypothetical protein